MRRQEGTWKLEHQEGMRKRSSSVKGPREQMNGWKPSLKVLQQSHRWSENANHDFTEDLQLYLFRFRLFAFQEDADNKERELGGPR